MDTSAVSTPLFLLLVALVVLVRTSIEGATPGPPQNDLRDLPDQVRDEFLVRMPDTWAWSAFVLQRPYLQDKPKWTRFYVWGLLFHRSDLSLSDRVRTFLSATAPGRSMHDLRSYITPQLARSLYNQLLLAPDPIDKKLTLITDLSYQVAVFRDVVSAFDRYMQDAAFVIGLPDLHLPRTPDDVPDQIREQIAKIVTRPMSPVYHAATVQKVRARYPPPFNAVFPFNTEVASQLYDILAQRHELDLLREAVPALLRYGLQFDLVLLDGVTDPSMVLWLFPLLRPSAVLATDLFRSWVADGQTELARALFRSAGFVDQARECPILFMQALDDIVVRGQHTLLRTMVTSAEFTKLLELPRGRGHESLRHWALRTGQARLIHVLIRNPWHAVTDDDIRQIIAQWTSSDLDGLQELLAGLLTGPSILFDWLTADMVLFADMMADAAIRGHRPDLLDLLSHIPNAYEIVNHRDRYGRTLLHRTFAAGLLDAVRAILRVPGVDVMVRDDNGCTPLAVLGRARSSKSSRGRSRYFPVAAWLRQALRRDASVFAVVIAYEAETVVEKLIEEIGHGRLADVTQLLRMEPMSGIVKARHSETGETLLHCAIRGRHADLVDWLIQRTDSNPFVADAEGRTALALMLLEPETYPAFDLIMTSPKFADCVREHAADIGNAVAKYIETGQNQRLTLAVEWPIIRYLINVREAGEPILLWCARCCENQAALPLLLSVPDFDPYRDSTAARFVFTVCKLPTPLIAQLGEARRTAPRPERLRFVCAVAHSHPTLLRGLVMDLFGSTFKCLVWITLQWPRSLPNVVRAL